MNTEHKHKMDARYLVGSLMLSIGLYGFYLAGPWNWLGVFAFIVVLSLDVGFPRDEAPRSVDSGGLQNMVLYLQLPLIIALWLLFAEILAKGDSSVFEMSGAILSLGFLSALGGLPPSHELMHRNGRFARFYGSLYITIFLLPMSDLGHVQGHHLKVASSEDSDTPRRGELVYTFAFRSLWGQMADSFKMERQRLVKLNRSLLSPTGRFFQSLVTVSLWLGIWFFVAGIAALPIYLLTMVILYLVLGGFNYTQHYGLIREIGKPIEVRHSWNQLKPFSRALSFEISNHSEHHLIPTRFYTDLTPCPEGPQLPSIALCFVSAFVPPIWEKCIVKPRLKYWDENFANEQERALAAEANKRAGWASL
ncbi:MAG: alkane 1-monooxygenase [Cycloclasticus sp.]|nr:alkane 1-monooxygenase [Cycloclasticus sp.]